MKRRLPILPLIALILSTLACILQMDAPVTLSPDQVNTLAAQTLAFYQYQTYVALGTQAIPPAAETAVQTGMPSVTNTQMPSVTNTLMPSPTNTVFIPSVTPTALPCNWAQFIADVNFPDNSEVGISDHFTKTWRLKNIGSCTWTSGYSLVFDHGDQMGAPASQQLTPGTVAPGATIDVSVNLLSPVAVGTYQGFFKLRASDSSLFGIGAGADVAFWVKVKVTAAALPTVQQKSTSTIIHAGNTGSVTTPCDPGTVVTGGGFSVSNDVLVYTQAKNGNGWTAVAKNNSGLDRTLIVFAECLTYPSASTTQKENTVTVNAGTWASQTAECDPGSIVTGGGYTSAPDGTMWTFASWQEVNGWKVSEKNTSAAAKDFHVYAVCLSGTPLSTIKKTAMGNIPAGGNGFVEVACDPGRVPTGGGFGLSDDELPYFSGFSSGFWRVYAHNTSGAARSLLTAVTCLG